MAACAFRSSLKVLLSAFAVFLSTVGVSRAYTITGDIVCDNEVMIFTAAAEGPSMTVTYAGVRACWPTPQPVSFTTGDRYLYLVCWSDDRTAQGLLHDLTVSGGTASAQVYSGSSLWQVGPGDTDIDGCSAPPHTTIASAITAKIPIMGFVDPAVGCANPPPGQDCYGLWGPVASIDLSAIWSWYDSGQQISADAPFTPGFNHREFLVFRLDMLQVLETPATSRSWGSLKTIYR